MVPVADRRRRWLALALALTLALAGCGISTTGTTDEGDGLETGTGLTDSDFLPPPSPDTAVSPEQLVDDFLRSASGGLNQVKAFLTEDALKTFHDPVNKDNPALTIVRLVGEPQEGVPSPDRTPVTVTYQVVGTLDDKGLVEELADPNLHKMVLQVVPNKQKPSVLRIDEIGGDAPDGLVLRDRALTEYYRPQPIYFWDESYSVLVPDLRYLPLTITAEQRASLVVQYLAAGPSPWVTGVKKLPLGAVPSEPVTSPNGTLVVKVTAQAAPGGEDDQKKLLYQLQWSVGIPNRPTKIALQIDDKIVNVNVGANDYQSYNLSSTFASGAQRYDITPEAKVVPIPAANPQGVLAAPQNQNVVYAAVSRRGDVAAFVRAEPSGRRYVEIVHSNGSTVRWAPGTNQMGRPAFYTSNGDVLVPVNGRLYAVSATDGSPSEALKSVNGVSAVSVAPDARRMAVVANGQVLVTSLPSATSQQRLRPILSGQFTATSVAWTSESWLIVAGAGALWRVTADGVVAEDLSGKLLGLTVNELLAYPQWPARPDAAVFALVAGHAYSFFTSQQSSLSPESYNAPFFGS